MKNTAQVVYDRIVSRNKRLRITHQPHNELEQHMVTCTLYHIERAKLIPQYSFHMPVLMFNEFTNELVHYMNLFWFKVESMDSQDKAFALA